MINGDTVYCDCCGSEVLAKVQEGKIIIKDRRHGTNHVAVISIQELLDKPEVRKYIIHNIESLTT